MAKPPLPVDWDIVKSLYLQGVSVPTLSERFGINANTLRARACKKGWNAAIGTEKQRKEQITEKSAAIARDIWAERREAIRENIHTIGSKMTSYAAQMPEDQLLAKADKVKIATEIAGKIVGLDRVEDRNVVNIAVLGAIDSPTESYEDFRVVDGLSKTSMIEDANRVEDTDQQSVFDPTTHPTTVEVDHRDSP